MDIMVNMGEIEKVIKERQKRANIQKIVLKTLLAGGLLSVAILAPNALQMLATLQKRGNRKKNPKYTVNNAIQRLLDKGHIKLQSNGNKKFFSITDKGKKALSILDLENFQIPKPKKWDRKWRVIIFDIEERKRGTRELLRRGLVQIGFLKLQNSVWIYPYDCEDLIFLLKTDFQLGRNVLYVVADIIENDKNLKKHFGLV